MGFYEKLFNGAHNTKMIPFHLKMTKIRKKEQMTYLSGIKNFSRLIKEPLFELILAANYLDIKGLPDVTCKTVANMIKGKTPEEIRKTFNIKNDFTPSEEEQVRKENEWCEEK